MNTAESIRALIKKNEFKTFACSVLQVNQSERTCDCRPLNGDADIFGVRLQSDINATSGLYAKPKIGSNVLVTIIRKNDAFVSLFSDVDNYEIVIGNTSFVMDGSTIKMNGGSLGGLVKVQANVSKLNTIENSINSLKQILTAWVPVSNDGGAALKTAITTWAGQALTPTTILDIEDTKVKH